MPVLDNEPFVLGDDNPDITANQSPSLQTDDFGPRPMTYYGDGPFDPPSSDEEADELIEKAQAQSGTQGRPQVSFEEDGILRVGQRKVCSFNLCCESRAVPNFVSMRPASLRILIISLATLVGAAVLIGIYAAFSYTGTPYRVQGVKHITMDHVFNGTFAAQSKSVLWVPEGEPFFRSRR